MANICYLRAERSSLFRVNRVSQGSKKFKSSFRVTLRATDNAGQHADFIQKFACIYADMNRLEGDILTFGSILAITNITLAVACVVWTFLNIKEKVVRFAQPIFLALIAVGCMISSSTIFFLGAQDALDGNADDARRADANCVMVPWLYSIGFMVTFGSLFAKTRKVYQIF